MTIILYTQVLPAAMEIAINENMDMRRGLPRDYLQYLGAAHCDKKASDPRRTEFITKLHRLLEKVVREVPVDAAADQFGKAFVHSALPPKLDKGREIVNLPANINKFCPLCLNFF
jgi:lysine-specific demethylase/histidyl-hydroxylase NO66